MKKITVVLLISLMLFSITGFTYKESKYLVAKVNDREISVSEYEKALALYKKNFESVYGRDKWNVEVEKGKTVIEVVKEQVLNNMIDDELLCQEAQKENVNVEDKYVEEKFKQFKTQVQLNQQFKKYLEDNSIDDKFLKNQFKKDMLISKYKDKYITSLKLNDEKLKVYYEKNKDQYKREEAKASHILFKSVDDNMKPISEQDKKIAKKKAEDILVRAKNGEDFAYLAKTYSEDTFSGINGGNLGYFGKGVMVPEFEKATFELKAGEISNLVETQFGYHIIKVVDRVSEIRPFEEVKNEMKDTIERDSYKGKIDQLQKDNKIEKFENNIKELKK